MLCPRRTAIAPRCLAGRRQTVEANPRRPIEPSSPAQVNVPRQKLPSPPALITHESAGPKRLLGMRMRLMLLVNAAFVAKLRSNRLGVAASRFKRESAALGPAFRRFVLPRSTHLHELRKAHGHWQAHRFWYGLIDLKSL